MAQEWPVMSCRDLPGDRWIAMSPAAREAEWTDQRSYFWRYVAPRPPFAWAEGPAERIEYDESARRVRLFIEGVALVPDVVGYPVGPR